MKWRIVVETLRAAVAALVGALTAAAVIDPEAALACLGALALPVVRP